MQTTDRKRELGRFFHDRRSRLQPSDVGLPPGGRRRVAGLRREEVAALAGVGIAWYTMLERGTAVGVSTTTLDAVVRALRLTPDEVAYVMRLAEERAVEIANPAAGQLSRRALEAIDGAPAYIITTRWVVLAWNHAMSLVWGIDLPGGEPFNIALRNFEDPAFRRMHGDNFPSFARALATMIRYASSAHLEDAEYGALCQRLRADPLFADVWDAYDLATSVGPFATTVTSVRLGTFTYESLSLDVPGDDQHWLVIQVPEVASAARLRAALATTR